MTPWLKLLVHNNRHGRFGLTLPFLVGAISLASDQSAPPIARLQGLLRSMRDETLDEYVIRLAECDRLHQPVAAITPGGMRPAIGVPIPSAVLDRFALYVESAYLQPGTASIDTFTEDFLAQCLKPIALAAYSYQAGRFVPFDDHDLNFIQAALAISDEDADLW